MTTPDKIALVTGASSGIGRALATQLQQHGFLVYATARLATDLAALTEAGFQALYLDVNDQSAIDQVAQTIITQHNRLDLLINNAGFGAMGPVLDCTPAQLQLQFQTNVFSQVHVTRSLLPLLMQSRGTVVNIGSVSGVLVTPFAGAYCASKAAVHALSDALRLELAPFGIGVLEVQPGAIESSFGRHASHQAEQLISEHSPWWPMRDGIRARANASQDNPTPASHVARNVFAAVSSGKRPRVLRIGNGSRALPLLAALLPGALLDRVLSRRFGLDRNL